MGNKSSKSGDSSKVDTTRSKKSYDKTYDHALLGGRTVNKNILLVGISGRGKSATGNSIFGSPVFRTFDSAATNPDSIVCESREVNGLKLTICDALTIQDVRMTEAESRMDIKARLHKCFDVCPTGFHFIIFVFSYTSRITSEEDDAMEVLTELFGEQFLIDQGISVFTHGENFDLERKRNGGPKFHTWHKKSQDPLLRKIFSNMETFMMYNVHSDKMTRQRQEILKIIRNCRLRVLREQHCYKVVDDVGEERYSHGRKMDTGPSSPRASRAEYGRRPSNVDEAQYRYRYSDEKRREDRDKTCSQENMEPHFGKHRSFQLKRKVEADLELFLIGRTGHGKSATGNTILGRKKFKSSDMAQSATLKTAAGWAHIGRHIVKVVDGPGLVDTRICGVKRLEQTEKNFMEGFVHCPDGFHALVLVLSYGTRFTDEEQKTVRLLKGMLGDDFIKKHCILAFTHGENFLMSNPDGNFEGWCRKQTGDLRQLMNECNNRVVLFYNLTPDKRDESIGRLMSLVYAFDERYTMEIFEQIHMKREEFILAEGAIQLKDLIQGKVDMTIDCLEKGRTNHHLDNLMQRLEEEIKKENKDLKVVMDVKQGIQKVRNKKYSEALQIFKVINYEADLLEFRFYSRAYMQLKQFMSEVPLDLFS